MSTTKEISAARTALPGRGLTGRKHVVRALLRHMESERFAEASRALKYTPLSVARMVAEERALAIASLDAIRAERRVCALGLRDLFERDGRPIGLLAQMTDRETTGLERTFCLKLRSEPRRFAGQAIQLRYMALSTPTRVLEEICDALGWSAVEALDLGETALSQWPVSDATVAVVNASGFLEADELSGVEAERMLTTAVRFEFCKLGVGDHMEQCNAINFVRTQMRLAPVDWRTRQEIEADRWLQSLDLVFDRIPRYLKDHVNHRSSLGVTRNGELVAECTNTGWRLVLVRANGAPSVIEPASPENGFAQIRAIAEDYKTEQWRRDV